MEVKMNKEIRDYQESMFMGCLLYTSLLPPAEPKKGVASA